MLLQVLAAVEQILKRQLLKTIFNQSNLPMKK